MPSTKYTRIEITAEAYLALEAETILQRKTLKKLASELIIKGISKEALDFAQKSIPPSPPASGLNIGNMSKVIKEIGDTGIVIDESILRNVEKVLVESGYSEAKLYVVQNTASMQRDELHRVLTICERNDLAISISADIIRNLNQIVAKK